MKTTALILFVCYLTLALFSFVFVSHSSGHNHGTPIKICLASTASNATCPESFSLTFHTNFYLSFGLSIALFVALQVVSMLFFFGLEDRRQIKKAALRYFNSLWTQVIKPIVQQHRFYWLVLFSKRDPAF